MGELPSKSKHNKMKKLATCLLSIILLISCELFDNRVEIAKRHVEEQYLQHQDDFPAKMVGFEKTNGENLSGTIWMESGTHKIYKLYYTATFEALTDGYVEVNKTTGSTYPIIYNERTKGLNCRADGSFIYEGYEKKELKIHDKIYIKGFVFFKKTESGWVYTPQ
jgi:uncharacterized protein YxeA